MTIVLNENEWAKEMIDMRTLGKNPFETLKRVARYYLDNHYNKKETRKLLDSFLMICRPDASLVKWSDTLDNALDVALRYEALDISGIEISTSELETINNLKFVQPQRLAFTLLCLAKYWNVINPNNDNWVNTKDNEIMKLAGLSVSLKKQGALYHDLDELGLLQFSKKVDGTNMRVCFVSPGETVMVISDYRNLGNQYLLHSGSKDYFQCQNCGIVTRKNTVIAPQYPQLTGRPQKYCKECAVSVRVCDYVNRAMRKETI